MKTHQRPTRPSRLQARQPGGRADYEEEEFDEIESLPREIEHDEEERDPDPERNVAPSEHAQVQRGGRHPQSRRESPPRR